MGLFSVSGENAVALRPSVFAERHVEKDIQVWADRCPALINDGKPMLSLGMEITTKHGLFIDNLYLDGNGTLVAAEMKQRHAHMLITMRPLDPSTGTGFTKRQGDGRAWNDFFSDPDAFKKDKAGKAFVSETEGLNRLRKAWADNLNCRLEAAGSEVRVDHRSLKDQHSEAVARGDLAAASTLDRPPEPKAGRARSMAKRGEDSERWAEVQEVRRIRQQAQALAPGAARRQERVQAVKRTGRGLTRCARRPMRRPSSVTSVVC